MEFGIKLKNLREKMGLSQEAMARELRVSFATINRLETGKTMPSYNTIIKFENLEKIITNNEEQKK